MGNEETVSNEETDEDQSPKNIGNRQTRFLRKVSRIPQKFIINVPVFLNFTNKVVKYIPDLLKRLNIISFLAKSREKYHSFRH